MQSLFLLLQKWRELNLLILTKYENKDFFHLNLLESVDLWRLRTSPVSKGLGNMDYERMNSFNGEDKESEEESWQSGRKWLSKGLRETSSWSP